MLLDISPKIDRAIATVLADLAEIATDRDIEIFVVGAMARDMILDYGFGIEAGRATRDIDLGIRVADWEEVERLVNLLEEGKWHCREQQLHRLVHKSGIPVDLIPFGAIESDDGSIRWPPHFNEALSVIGFADAYADCWRVQLRQAPSLDIRVAGWSGTTQDGGVARPRFCPRRSRCNRCKATDGTLPRSRQCFSNSGRVFRLAR